MKGYFVWVGDWGDYVHGNNATEAKTRFWNTWGNEAEEWINLQPIRLPRFDNKPITRELIKEGLTPFEIIEYQADTQKIICNCEICKREVTP